jgi:hypothetical protein
VILWVGFWFFCASLAVDVRPRRWPQDFVPKLVATALPAVCLATAGALLKGRRLAAGLASGLPSDLSPAPGGTNPIDDAAWSRDAEQLATLEGETRGFLDRVSVYKSGSHS